ncbi:MAG TPA: hypothetical protein PK691_06480, partial [Thermomicrobiales bacterium]|nr:hypothetical protein [Thermomicrobiales bacterium]
PVTIAILTLVIVAALLTATNTPAEHQALLNTIGMDLHALRHGHVFGIPLATFVQSSPGVEWHMLLLVALPLLALELLAGSKRALIAFLASDWLTAPITVLVLWALSGMGSDSANALLHQPDTGSSAAAHGALACAIVLLPKRLTITCMTILVGISLWALTFEILGAAIAHLLGIGTGALIGLWFRAHPVQRCSADMVICD